MVNNGRLHLYKILEGAESDNYGYMRQNVN